MTQYVINVNNDKTNIIYLDSAHYVKFLKTSALHIGASSIIPNGLFKKIYEIFMTNVLIIMNMWYQYAELSTTVLRKSTV